MSADAPVVFDPNAGGLYPLTWERGPAYKPGELGVMFVAQYGSHTFEVHRKQLRTRTGYGYRLRVDGRWRGSSERYASTVQRDAEAMATWSELGHALASFGKPAEAAPAETH